MKTMILVLCFACVTATLHAGTLPPAAETNRTILITGEVSKPGTYPFQEGMTLTQAIATAGGFTVFSDVRVRIFRDPGGFADIPAGERIQTDDKKDSVLVNVRKIERKQAPDIMLKPGDWIAVQRNVD
jgi:polysaccharide export outer membrane protein